MTRIPDESKTARAKCRRDAQSTSCMRGLMAICYEFTIYARQSGVLERRAKTLSGGCPIIVKYPKHADLLEIRSTTYRCIRIPPLYAVPPAAVEFISSNLLGQARSGQMSAILELHQWLKPHVSNGNSPDAVYEMTVIARYGKVVLAGERGYPSAVRRNRTP